MQGAGLLLRHGRVERSATTTSLSEHGRIPEAADPWRQEPHESKGFPAGARNTGVATKHSGDTPSTWTVRRKGRHMPGPSLKSGEVSRQRTEPEDCATAREGRHGAGCTAGRRGVARGRRQAEWGGLDRGHPKGRRLPQQQAPCRAKERHTQEPTPEQSPRRQRSHTRTEEVHPEERVETGASNKGRKAAENGETPNT